MLLRLNRELKNMPVCVVVGYSFNDPVIREIFLRNCDSKKHLILVHPHAKQVCNNRLKEIKANLIPMEKKFGMEESFREVNHQIIHKFRKTPRFGANDVPISH